MTDEPKPPKSDEPTPASQQTPPSDRGSHPDPRQVESDSAATGAEGTPGSSASGEEAVDPVAAAQAEAARLKDQLLRTAADFDNFRKRSRRELEEAERRGRDDLLKELLPVFDNLERAVTHGSTTQTTDTKALVEGIELVLRQFADTLRRIGVERVPGVGEPFDPSVHEAIQHLETADFPPGTIAAEVQPGYRTSERLVRPALVVVAKAPSSGSDNGAGSSSEAN